MSNTQIEMINEFIKCYLVWCISSGKFNTEEFNSKDDDDKIEFFKFEVSNNWKEGFDIIKFCEHAGTTAKEVIGDAETACLLTGIIQEFYRNEYGDENLMPMKDFNCETLLRHAIYYFVNENEIVEYPIKFIADVTEALKVAEKKECLNLIKEIRLLVEEIPCDDYEYVYHIRNRHEIIFETHTYSDLHKKFDELKDDYDRDNGYLLATKSRLDDEEGDDGYEEMFEYQPEDLKPLCDCGEDVEDVEDNKCYNCFGWVDCRECGKRFCSEEFCEGCLEDRQNGVPLDCDRVICAKCQIKFHPKTDCFKFDLDTCSYYCSVCAVWETTEPLKEEKDVVMTENIPVTKKRIIRKKTPPLEL
jgi:hypothetical protein